MNFQGRSFQKLHVDYDYIQTDATKHIDRIYRWQLTSMNARQI